MGNAICNGLISPAALEVAQEDIRSQAGRSSCRIKSLRRYVVCKTCVNTQASLCNAQHAELRTAAQHRTQNHHMHHHAMLQKWIPKLSPEADSPEDATSREEDVFPDRNGDRQKSVSVCAGEDLESKTLESAAQATPRTSVQDGNLQLPAAAERCVVVELYFTTFRRSVAHGVVLSKVQSAVTARHHRLLHGRHKWWIGGHRGMACFLLTCHSPVARPINADLLLQRL